MPLTVQDFRAQLKYGGARPTLFKVTLPFPLVSPDTDASTKLTFTCEAASLPANNISAIQIMYMGRQTKWAGDRTFDDWNITVINDEDFKVRKAFDRWLSALNSHYSNLRNAGAVETTGYQVDAFVTQLSRTGEVIEGYKFVGMFPTSVTPIELAWGATDTIERFNVALSYQWWENAQTDGQGGVAFNL